MKSRVNRITVCLAVLLIHPGSILVANEGRITLTFLGDIMAHSVNYAVSDYGRIYDRIRELLHQDQLTFANLESPVDATGPYATYPRFNVRPAYVRAAVEAGVEVFSLANNHAYDQGREGLFQTLRSLARLKKSVPGTIYYAGIRGNLLAPFRPLTIRQGGVKIGFLAVTQTTNLYHPFPYVQAVDYLEEDASTAFLDFIRRVSRDYDLLILSYHGGNEYTLDPDPQKLRFFYRLLEAGVHIVYGHHPHVLQPYHLVQVNGKKRLILLSTGNLISGMTWSVDPKKPGNPVAYRGDSALWVVRVVHSANHPWERRQVSVEKVKPVLVTNYKNPRGEMVVDTFAGLLERGLAEPWRSYYQSRYRIMDELVRGWRNPESPP